MACPNAGKVTDKLPLYWNGGVWAPKRTLALLLLGWVKSVSVVKMTDSPILSWTIALLITAVNILLPFKLLLPTAATVPPGTPFARGILYPKTTVEASYWA